MTFDTGINNSNGFAGFSLPGSDVFTGEVMQHLIDDLPSLLKFRQTCKFARDLFIRDEKLLGLQAFAKHTSGLTPVQDSKLSNMQQFAIVCMKVKQKKQELADKKEEYEEQVKQLTQKIGEVNTEYRKYVDENPMPSLDSMALELLWKVTELSAKKCAIVGQYYNRTKDSISPISLLGMTLEGIENLRKGNWTAVVRTQDEFNKIIAEMDRHLKQ